MRRQVRRDHAGCVRSHGAEQNGLCLQDDRVTTGVTGAAIQVQRSRGLEAATVRSLGLIKVLMLVVPNVLCACRTFVLAIARHSSPTELHRQEGNKKNE